MSGDVGEDTGTKDEQKRSSDANGRVRVNGRKKRRSGKVSRRKTCEDTGKKE